MSETASRWRRQIYTGECTDCKFRNTFETTETPIDGDDVRENWCERCADIVDHRVVALEGGDDA